MNVTRFTGTCMTLLIADKCNMHDKFFLRENVRIPQNITFDDILKYRGSKDLLFNKKSKSGVFPHVFYPKYNTCLLSVFGKNKKETYEKYNKFVNRFGLKQSTCTMVDISTKSKYTSIHSIVYIYIFDY